MHQQFGKEFLFVIFIKESKEINKATTMILNEE